MECTCCDEVHGKFRADDLKFMACSLGRDRVKDPS